VTGAANGEVVIELRGLHKAFRDERVLRGVDLAVRDGETLTILGGSGSGKSVCLKHMIGLLKPDAGRVLILGEDITDSSEHQLVDVRKALSMVFQSAALFDSLSVYENVAYPVREHSGWPEPRIAERVRECLEAVGLRGAELEPRAILYDEPTTGLDPANQRRIGELIHSLQRRLRVTSVIVTHELELCFAVSDRVALLKDGRIVVEGTAEAMRASDHPDVRAFLAGEQDALPEPVGEAAWRGGPDGP
jgi:phospholipid/cholesterol/gamma-HCH transport system ATP-binding protein